MLSHTYICTCMLICITVSVAHAARKSANCSPFTPLSANCSFREQLRFGAHALVPQVRALSKLLFTLFVVTRRCGGQFALRLEAGASLLFSAGDSLQSVVSSLLTCFKTRLLYIVYYYPAIFWVDLGQADHARMRGPPMDTSVSPRVRWRYAYGA